MYVYIYTYSLDTFVTKFTKGLRRGLRVLARTKLSSKAEKLRDDIPRRVQNNDDKTMGVARRERSSG